MRKPTILSAMTFFFLPLTFAQEQKEEEDVKVRDDKAQIRKSLRKMDRVAAEKVRARLSLVIREGISGLDPKAKPPEPGQMAPDFELTPLRFYQFRIEESEVTKKNAGALYKPVRLSDFRGKKAVVLIFGSYT